MRASKRDFLASLEIVSGAVRPDALTLYAVMRDEAFFLPAFLDHYRAIGVEQFVILDDGSADGTGELLRAAPDCVVLRAPWRFGDVLTLRRAGLWTRRRRAGTAFKEWAPDRFLAGRWALHADADEFLVLPPGAPDLRAVIAALDARGARCCAASVAEAFPPGLDGLAPHPPATGLADLLARYPMIEPHAVLRLRRGRQAARVAPSKTGALMAAHGVPGTAGSARVKTPLIRHAWPVRRRGSHKASVPPPSWAMLTVLHFVFTAQMRAKVARAREWRAHVDGAASYDRYAALLDALEASGGALAGPGSARYAGPGQLIDAGLMRWPGADGA